MKTEEHLQFVSLVLQKLYPSYGIFIESLIKKIQPFYLGKSDREEAQFIFFMALQPKEKLQAILRDFLSLSGLASETVLLLENPDINGFNIYSQFKSFQMNYPVLPKVILTDFIESYLLEDLYAEVPQERNSRVIEEFLKEREKLDFSYFDLTPSDARQTLVLSLHRPFGYWNFSKIRLTFKFIWENKISSMDEFKSCFIPEDFDKPISLGLLRKDDLIFFSKDKPSQLKFSFNLLKLHGHLENHFSRNSDYPIKISYMAMEYFALYYFYKKPNYNRLKREAEIFFLPVFHQIPRMCANITEKVESLEIDFKAGWKININHHQS